LDDYYLNLLDWGPMNNVVCYSLDCMALLHKVMLVPQV